MGRPRQFNEETVLNKAIGLFGERGFEALSVDAVLSELGLNRASFYKLYGSKYGLFRSALRSACESYDSAHPHPQARDLVIIALVELAPTNAELRALALRGYEVCFGADERQLADHLLRRARRTTSTNGPS